MVKEFEGAVWPADHQAVINYVERILKNNSHLYTEGDGDSGYA